jgi:hypothetical protein
MPPEKIKRHFDREKLMPLARRACRPQGLLPPPVKSRRQPPEYGVRPVETDSPLPFQVQADFNGAGMKTSSPIKLRARLEIMPLEADPGAEHAAMQMPPPLADLPPRRNFCEYRRDIKFNDVARVNFFSGCLRHGDNVPHYAKLVNFKPPSSSLPCLLIGLWISPLSVYIRVHLWRV